MELPKKGQNWTIGQMLEWTTKHLKERGFESPTRDAQLLLAHVLGCEKIDLYGSRFFELATPDIRQAFRELVQRRIDGCPVFYIIGKREFYSLELEVTLAVLIPRPDSETLVDQCREVAALREYPQILDVGTGSGCLAIAVAHQVPNAHITAIDISEAALEVAKRNAERHNVVDRITFLHGDLFEPIPPGESYDIIMSNPPYIPTDEIETLEINVRDYEPHLALDGGADGFVIFDRLIAEAPNFFGETGYLLLEIGSPQEQPARERISTYPFYELARTVHDHAGLPRVMRATYHRPVNETLPEPF